MPRAPRAWSQSDIYHVVARGVGRVLIFEDDLDREYFHFLLKEALVPSEVTVYAWCFMSNHVHLLIRAELHRLSETMKQIESRYAMYFNKRHSRVGHLFQGRFHSEPVDDEAYFLTVIRYIHANPEEAGVCAMDEYSWSSYREYLGAPHLCSTNLALDLLGGVEQFAEFHKSDKGTIACMASGAELNREDDDIVRRAIVNAIGEETLRSLPTLEKHRRDSILRSLLSRGLSIRKLERITGVSRGVIQRISANMKKS